MSNSSADALLDTSLSSLSLEQFFAFAIFVILLLFLIVRLFRHD